jgi:hypothetical protein
MLANDHAPTPQGIRIVLDDFGLDACWNPC